jgi:hypothetical protein
LETAINRLTINTLRAQLVLRRRVCESLVKELDAEDLTFEQRVTLAHRWEYTMAEIRELGRSLWEQERQESADQSCESSGR